MSAHLFYPLWLRLWHWVNAACFIILMITGTSMHFAEPGTPQLDFRTARILHNSGAIVIMIGYAVYLFGNLVGRNGEFYRLKKGEIPGGMLRQARYYLQGIFRGEPHPFPHSEENKFNPLQKIAYAVVMYVLFPILSLSGVMLFLPEQAPDRVQVLTTTFSGVSFYAFLHTIVGYLLSLFMVVHIYLGTTGESPTALYRAMLSGSRHS